MPNKKTVIVVAGPTAVGKTAMGINLARQLGTEIISADSRQFYKEMELGTAKPDAHELSQAKHHLVNSLSIHEDYTVADFERDALAILEKIFEQNDTAIVVGGSGLYVKALCDGMDEIPEVPAHIRDDLRGEIEQFGLEKLLEELAESDAVYYQQVDRQNPQRVLRALEVCRGTGKPYSAFRTGNKVQRSFQSVKIGLHMERELLYARIDERMDRMIDSGLFDEAAQLFPYRHLNALQTVGYTEIFECMEGNYDKEEAIRLLKRNSRRYAKRQLTWFRKDPEFVWFTPETYSEIMPMINARLS